MSGFSARGNASEGFRHLEREQLESRGGQVPLSLVQHRLLPHRAVLRGLLRMVDSLGGVRAQV